MHINSERRFKTLPALRPDEAHAARAPSAILSRTEYRRMVAEILG